MQSVYKTIRKCKLFLKGLNTREDIFVVLIIILVGFGGFGLGRLSKIEEGREPVFITNTDWGDGKNGSRQQTPSITQGATVKTILEKQPMQAGGRFVASVRGSRYHSPWCSGALRIKEENKIWFDTKEEAEKAGYTPAKNCKGL